MISSKKRNRKKHLKYLLYPIISLWTSDTPFYHADLLFRNEKKGEPKIIETFKHSSNIVKMAFAIEWQRTPVMYIK